VANTSTPINQSLIMDVGETGSPMPIVMHMVWRSLNAFLVRAFGEMSDVPPRLTLIIWHCKKTLNTATKPKPFQNK
jgi:hypothetical protein